MRNYQQLPGADTAKYLPSICPQSALGGELVLEKREIRDTRDPVDEIGIELTQGSLEVIELAHELPFEP